MSRILRVGSIFLCLLVEALLEGWFHHYREAVFEVALVASLIKRTRAMSDDSWMGSIFRKTWKPFAGTVGVSFLSGLVLHSFFPEAVRLPDILWKG
jgi:hypothetical protein